MEHDHVVEQLFAPNGDRVEDEPLGVGADAARVLRADGTQAVVLASGETSTTVPATCASGVAAFWPEGRAILTRCDDDEDRHLTLHDPTGVHRIELPSAYVSPGWVQRGRVVRIAGALPIRIDLATRTIIADARVIATSRYGLLESGYGGDVRFRAYGTITETSFVRGIDPASADRFREESVNGRYTAFWHGYSVSIFDFAEGRVVGTVPHSVLAVGPDGRALMHTRYAGRRGPLCWVTPTPEPSP